MFEHKQYFKTELGAACSTTFGRPLDAENLTKTVFTTGTAAVAAKFGKRSVPAFLQHSEAASTCTVLLEGINFDMLDSEAGATALDDFLDAYVGVLEKYHAASRAGEAVSAPTRVERKMLDFNRACHAAKRAGIGVFVRREDGDWIEIPSRDDIEVKVLGVTKAIEIDINEAEVQGTELIDRSTNTFHLYVRSGGERHTLEAVLDAAADLEAVRDYYPKYVCLTGRFSFDDKGVRAAQAIGQLRIEVRPRPLDEASVGEVGS